MIVEFLAEARAEIAEAVRWYDERRRDLGDRLLAAVRDTACSLPEHRQRHTVIARAKAPVPVRRARVTGFPYALVFVELPDRIRVIALAHDRRRPRYWRARLP